MKKEDRTITFRDREFFGSRLRCLLLTSQAREKVAASLTSLAAPHATVTSAHHWAPSGLLWPNEAEIDKAPDFLSADQRKDLARWWLAATRRAPTPNWDLVSTCAIGDRTGLLLVEAKAHRAEFADDRCGASNPDNIQQIKTALAQATTGWNGLMPGFALSTDSHYQLCNRFAFAWKLATMGVPVVLVYLGFLDAHEMDDGTRVLFRDHDQWRRCVVEGSRGIVPEAAWDRSFHVGGIPLTVLIRSAEVGIFAR